MKCLCTGGKQLTCVKGADDTLGNNNNTTSQEKYDNYLTKLQNICTGGTVGEESKPVYETMKSAIQNMSSVLPTPT